MKERLVGAAVLVAIAVWLVPWVLDGPEGEVETPGSSLQLPSAEEPMPMRTQTLRLGDAPESTAETEAPPAVTLPRRDTAGRGERDQATEPARTAETLLTRRLRAEPEPTRRGRGSARECRTGCGGADARADYSGEAAGGSDGRLDGATRQLQRGSQRAAARTARRNLRLQGRGFELSKRRADVVSRARRPSADASRGRCRGFVATGSWTDARVVAAR